MYVKNIYWESPEVRALKSSIDKWIKIYRGEAEDLGPKNCALCKKYIARMCVGCPVSDKTGIKYCEGSPYTKFDEGLQRLFKEFDKSDKVAFDTLTADELVKHKLIPSSKVPRSRLAVTPKLQKLAAEEALFLIGLLPPEHQKEYFA